MKEEELHKCQLEILVNEDEFPKIIKAGFSSAVSALSSQTSPARQRLKRKKNMHTPAKQLVCLVPHIPTINFTQYIRRYGERCVSVCVCTSDVLQQGDMENRQDIAPQGPGLDTCGSEKRILYLSTNQVTVTFLISLHSVIRLNEILRNSSIATAKSPKSILGKATTQAGTRLIWGYHGNGPHGFTANKQHEQDFVLGVFCVFLFFFYFSNDVPFNVFLFHANS